MVVLAAVVALAEPASALMKLSRVLMTFADPGWATGR
jgi:hypothetical protein